MELPVTLMHSKPIDVEPLLCNLSPTKAVENKPTPKSGDASSSAQTVDHNLISFEAR